MKLNFSDKIKILILCRIFPYIEANDFNWCNGSCNAFLLFLFSDSYNSFKKSSLLLRLKMRHKREVSCILHSTRDINNTLGLSMMWNFGYWPGICSLQRLLKTSPPKWVFKNQSAARKWKFGTGADVFDQNFHSKTFYFSLFQHWMTLNQSSKTTGSLQKLEWFNGRD